MVGEGCGKGRWNRGGQAEERKRCGFQGPGPQRGF